MRLQWMTGQEVERQRVELLGELAEREVTGAFECVQFGARDLLVNGLVVCGQRGQVERAVGDQSWRADAAQTTAGVVCDVGLVMADQAARGRRIRKELRF